MELLSKPYSIRLTKRCERAWLYLQKHKINQAYLLREGGEIAVINKANEFYLKDKRDKLIPNPPSWLYK